MDSEAPSMVWWSFCDEGKISPPPPPHPTPLFCIQSSQLKYCGRRYALCVEWGECSVLVLFSFYPRSIELLGWMFHPRMDEKGVGFSAQLDLAKVREWERKFDRHKVEWKQVCKDANMWEGKKEDTGLKSQKFVIELEWVCPKFTHQLSLCELHRGRIALEWR